MIMVYLATDKSYSDDNKFSLGLEEMVKPFKDHDKTEINEYNIYTSNRGYPKTPKEAIMIYKDVCMCDYVIVDVSPRDLDHSNSTFTRINHFLIEIVLDAVDARKKVIFIYNNEYTEDQIRAEFGYCNYKNLVAMIPHNGKDFPVEVFEILKGKKNDDEHPKKYIINPIVNKP